MLRSTQTRGRHRARPKIYDLPVDGKVIKLSDENKTGKESLLQNMPPADHDYMQSVL